MAGKQTEMEGMPKGQMSDAVGELIKAWEDLQSHKAEVYRCKEKLMPILKKANKLEIKVDGVIIKYREGAEGITVAREPNKE